MNAAGIGDGMFSQAGIFFMPADRRVVAMSAQGVSLPVKVEPREGRFGAGPVARRVPGAKWCFRKGPFFSREHKR